MATANVLIDISHYNTAVDLHAAKADGILGVIHKASQGLNAVDPQYSRNRQKALDADLLWGAYHFGAGADGINQAEHFLSTTGADANTLLVLDFERNPAGPSMTIDQAHAFVTHIHDVTGKYPGFYTGNYIRELLGPKKDSLLAKCWLWLAQYSSIPEVPATWDYWTLWQYTDGVHGGEPRSVKGIGACDRDKFNGSVEQLRKLWGVPEIPLA